MSTTTTYSLEQYKSEKEKELERQRALAKQEANATAAKLQKYLAPSERTAREGYSQGVTESTALAAEISRQKALQSADSAYAAGVNELMDYYRAEKGKEQDAAYESALAAIESWDWNEKKTKLENFIKGYEGKVNDVQMMNLQNILDSFQEDYIEVKDARGKTYFVENKSVDAEIEEKMKEYPWGLTAPINGGNYIKGRDGKVYKIIGLVE